MSSGRFRVRGCHPLWPRFPARSAIVLSPYRRRSYNPARCLDTRGLGSCAFARHYWRNHCYFLFLRVLGCFGSPRSLDLIIQAVDGSRRPGFPIRTSAGRRAFAPNRGFSQLVTSFVASESHRHPPCALLCFPFSFQLRRRLPPPRRSGKKAFALQFIYCSLDSRLISLLLSFWL